MHVMVLGAGVTGVTTAWYLLEAGFDVTVVERCEGPAQETSQANGGQVSISHPEPWSSPEAPMIAFKSLLQRNGPLRIGFGTDMARWRWLLSFLRECLPSRHWRNAHAIATLASHSGQCLKALRERTGIRYAHAEKGILHLFYSQGEVDRLADKVRFLSHHGIAARVVTPRECVSIEPALTHIAPYLAGALYAPDDESGDARLFTEELAKLAAARGARFLYDTKITRLVRSEEGIQAIETLGPDGQRQQLRADAYVACLGSLGTALLAEVAPRLPVYPVKGYSVTVPIRHPEAVTRVSLTDESRRIVCSRLDDRLRVAGTAEVVGFDMAIHEHRCEPLLEWIEALFPGATDTKDATLWAGLRPCTPAYVPIIGRSTVNRLWLNTGHGSLGWTLSCGSADLVARLLRGETDPLPGFPQWHNKPG